MAHEITLGRLSNGIRYVLVDAPDTYGAMVQTTIQAGSRHESEEQNGLAHFLEHMAFKGTKTKSSKELSLWIESLGGSINAMTGSSSTTYYASLYGKHVDEGIAFISDILNNPVFDENAIASERMVINQEIAMYKDDGMSCALNIASDLAHPNHPLGRPILGTEDTIAKFTRDDFVKFTNDHYVSGNMIIGIAGSINKDAVIDQLENEYSHKVVAEASLAEAAIFMEGSKSEYDDSAQSNMVMLFETPHGDTDEYRSFSLAAAILGNGMSSMLFQTIREELGLCYGISSAVHQSEDHAVGMIYSSTTPDNLDTLTENVCKTLREAPAAITDDMVKQAKIKMVAPYVMSYDGPIGTMHQSVHELSLYRELVGPEKMIQKYESITLNQIKDAMSRILDAKMVYVTYGSSESKYDIEGIKDMLHA